MIYGRMGGKVKFLRMATPEDAKLENRKPDDQDRERCSIGYLMVGRFVHDDGTESEDRLFELAYLKADGGWKEIKEAAVAAGNTIIGCDTPREAADATGSSQVVEAFAKAILMGKWKCDADTTSFDKDGD